MNHSSQTASPVSRSFPSEEASCVAMRDNSVRFELFKTSCYPVYLRIASTIDTSIADFPCSSVSRPLPANCLAGLLSSISLTRRFALLAALKQPLRLVRLPPLQPRELVAVLSESRAMLAPVFGTVRFLSSVRDS